MSDEFVALYTDEVQGNAGLGLEGRPMQFF